MEFSTSIHHTSISSIHHTTAPKSSSIHHTTHVVKTSSKEQVVGATTTVDKILESKNQSQNHPLGAAELRELNRIGVNLKSNGDGASGTDNKINPKTRIKTPDSLRQVAKPLIEPLEAGSPFPLRRHH